MLPPGSHPCAHGAIMRATTSCRDWGRMGSIMPVRSSWARLLLAALAVLTVACSERGATLPNTPATTAGTTAAGPLPDGCTGDAPSPTNAPVAFAADGRAWATTTDGRRVWCLFEVRDPGPFLWGPRGDRVVLDGLEVRGVGGFLGGRKGPLLRQPPVRRHPPAGGLLAGRAAPPGAGLDGRSGHPGHRRAARPGRHPAGPRHRQRLRRPPGRPVGAGRRARPAPAAPRGRTHPRPGLARHPPGAAGRGRLRGAVRPVAGRHQRRRAQAGGPRDRPGRPALARPTARPGRTRPGHPRPGRPVDPPAGGGDAGPAPAILAPWLED